MEPFLFMIESDDFLQDKKLLRQEAKYAMESSSALLFILVGERNYMEYLKARIELISTKYPLDLINIEHQYS